MILESISNKAIDALGNKIADVLKKGKEQLQLVRVVYNPTSYIFGEIDDATTSSNAYPDLLEPNIKFENPKKKDVVLTEFSLIPDNNFLTHGLVEVYANDVIIFRSKKAGNFENIASLMVKIIQGKTVKRDHSVKILIKNDDDSTAVKLAVQLTYGE